MKFVFVFFFFIFPAALKAQFTEADWMISIRGEPLNDVRRLAFADWLDDQGLHDRAAFIRLSIELVSLTKSIENSVIDPKAPAVSAEKLNRMRDVVDNLQKLPNSPLKMTSVYSHPIHSWERGLPVISISLSELLSSANRLFEGPSPIIGLHIKGAPENMTGDYEKLLKLFDLFNSKGLTYFGLEAMSLDQSFLSQLRNSAFAQNVRKLSIVNMAYTSLNSLYDLINSNVPAMEEIEIRFPRPSIRTDSILPFSQLPGLQRLRRFKLYFNGLSWTRQEVDETISAFRTSRYTSHFLDNPLHIATFRIDVTGDWTSRPNSIVSKQKKACEFLANRSSLEITRKLQNKIW